MGNLYRPLIVTSHATSLSNVAKDIAKVAQKLGKQPMLLDYLPPPFTVKESADSAIVVMTFNPLLSNAWFLFVRDLLRNSKIPALVYTTTEGRLPKRYIKPWLARDVIFVANSLYTKQRLEEVGVPVKTIVYHGVDFETAKIGMQMKPVARQKLEELVGQGIIFVTIASAHKRKGMDLYSVIVKKVVEKCNECKFFILTGSKAAKFFRGIPGVYVETNFGKLNRADIFAILAAADWYVQPSLAEGFGLPVLEAMSVGTPVIIPDYMPLTEFTEPSCALKVPIKTVYYDSFGEGIEYELHIYDVDEFVATILEAVEISKKDKQTYKEMSNAAVEKALKFNIDELYPKLFDILEEIKAKLL